VSHHCKPKVCDVTAKIRSSVYVPLLCSRLTRVGCDIILNAMTIHGLFFFCSLTANVRWSVLFALFVARSLPQLMSRLYEKNMGCVYDLAVENIIKSFMGES